MTFRHKSKHGMTCSPQTEAGVRHLLARPQYWERVK